MRIAVGCVRGGGWGGRFSFRAAAFDGPPSSEAPGEWRARKQSARFLALRNGSQLHQSRQLCSEVFAMSSLGTSGDCWRVLDMILY